MKRILLLIACLLLYVLTSCSGTLSEEETISRSIGVSVDSGFIEEYTDTHGGFHGDGEAYAKIAFSDESFCDLVKDNPDWQPLPLPKTLKVVLYGGTLDNGDSWSSFIENENDTPQLPDISDGYYFFKDRYSGGTDEKDVSVIFERYSMNFTLAIYDTDSKTLYFYEIDT